MATAAHSTSKLIERVNFPGTDLEVIVTLEDGDLTMELHKSNVRLHRVVVEQATASLDNMWLADMFVREERVRLADISADMTDYLSSLNISQG